MQEVVDICSTRFENSVAVLMARIVDRAGVAIQRSEVAAIDYSIFERGRRGHKRLAIIAGHTRIGLPVDDVLHDYLEVGGLWTLDVAGYNFRHEIVGRQDDFPKTGATYEIIYMFTTTFGEKVAVRFVLGAMKL